MAPRVDRKQEVMSGGPFKPSIKSHFWKISSTCGNQCPQKGSRNEETALRTRKRYPHEGSSVARLLGRIQKFVLGTSYVHIDSRFDLEVVRIVHP